MHHFYWFTREQNPFRFVGGAVEFDIIDNIISGNNEVLVASRDNIADNIGNSLSLDVNNNQILDNVMKSGNAIQQRVVYVLKSSPTADMSVKSSLTFSSVPMTQ